MRPYPTNWLMMCIATKVIVTTSIVCITIVRTKSFKTRKMAGQQQKIKCGLLGCTGMVGQRFIQLLEGHPQFELAVLGASPRSAGQEYQKACQWRLSTPLPQQMSAMTVQLCKPEHFAACRIVFSGLDSDVAGEIELEFSAAGFAVFSNAKNHRMAADVPLVVPLVNADHLQMV